MKKLLASLVFAAAVGCAANSFADSLSLERLGILPSEAKPASPISDPSAIVAPLVYNGTTVGSPVFNRPVANGTSAPIALSAVGTAVPYDVVMFSVATAGTYNFLSTATSSGFDNYTVLYQGVFNAASPLTGVIIANDDLGNTTTSGFSKALSTGILYSFVTTGYSNTDAGSFTDAITLASVPEPATWLLMFAGAAGLAAWRRLRPAAV